MKTVSLFLASILFACCPTPAAAADVVTLNIPTPLAPGRSLSAPITLAEGDSATLVGRDGNAHWVALTIGGQTKDVQISNPAQPFVMAGPASFSLVADSSAANFVWASFKVSRAGGNASVPAQTVVIPEDATGQFQVVLESSTDLVTWTAANPGTYGGSTQRRFFRTRIVRQN